jgi:cytosine/adenosine deaminase-related metal-dependent hydrolase
MQRLAGISGNIFWNGKMRKGTLVSGGKNLIFTDKVDTRFPAGTAIPGLINSHIHVGDSFVEREPPIDLKEAVGPGGFKHRMLHSAKDADIRAGIKSAAVYMASTGTVAAIDFRENGIKGIRQFTQARIRKPTFVTLGRPSEDLADMEQVIQRSTGVAMSSVSDHDTDYMIGLAERARKAGRKVAIHFSERSREDIETLRRIKPDLVIHCLFATNEDLNIIRQIGARVVITPRSNIAYGLSADYGRFLVHGIIPLLGTDNVMMVEPDILSEMQYLYLTQRHRTRIEPETIISMATSEPRNMLDSWNLEFPNNVIIYYPGALRTPYEIVSRPHMGYSLAQIVSDR